MEVLRRTVTPTFPAIEEAGSVDQDMTPVIDFAAFNIDLYLI